MNIYIHQKSANISQVKNLTNAAEKYISESIFRTLFRTNIKMLLSSLRKSFENNWTGRALGAALAFSAVATPIAAIPGPANDAYAQSGQVAAAPADQGLNAVQGMRDMRHYSENKQVQGIGIFINLQANAAGKGDAIGRKIQEEIAKRDPSVVSEYRLNQSRGTGTAVTFYVKGIDFTYSLGEVKSNIGQILGHHSGAWLPERTLADNKPLMR